MRRPISLAILVVLLALPAAGEVRLVVRPDGSKAILNDGRASSGDGLSASTLAWLARQRNRASQYDAIIEQNAKRYNVDPVLIRAVILVESNFDPAVVSHKGARGLMQLMPQTARRFGVRDIHDPEENIRGGVAYLAFLLDLHRNDLSLTLASYNAGENAVARYRGIPPYKETREYVQKALTVYNGRPSGGTIAVRPTSGGTKLSGGFTQAGLGLPAFAASTARRN